jgi:hypothetical protein
MYSFLLTLRAINPVFMARRRVKQQICPNCDYIFNETDNYCPNCGQENHTHKLPVRHFLIDYLEGAYHFDTKMVRTLQDLLLRPGRITVNFNQNKRARYVPPLRLYVFVSFVFFFLVAVIPDNHGSGVSDGRTEQLHSVALQKDSDGNDDGDVLEGLADIHTGKHKSAYAKALYDSICRTPAPGNTLIDAYLTASGKKLLWYNRNLQRNIVKLNTGHYTVDEIKHRAEKTISSLMFFMMPVFALLLWLFFYRKKMYFTEHLVFSIHLHCIAFIVLIAYQLASMAGFHYFSVAFLIILLYGLLGAKRVYGSKWMPTIVKVLSAGFFYSLSLAMVFLLGIVISFFG